MCDRASYVREERYVVEQDDPPGGADEEDEEVVALQRALDEISQSAPLGPDEEERLVRLVRGARLARALARRGFTQVDGVELSKVEAAGDRAARELWSANRHLVLAVARRYYDPQAGPELSQLLKWGDEGLLHAVHATAKGQPRRRPFGRYASWWIRTAIVSGVRGSPPRFRAGA
jgi:DNA-directed RNA polymerase sigma subunit (sigma70/sigma32)